MTKYDKTRNVAVHDDCIETMIQDASVPAAGVATVTFESPRLGKFWLVDRLSCAAAASTLLTLYRNAATPPNFIDNVTVSVGEGGARLNFDPPLELAPGENLVLQATAAGTTTIFATLWYRLRHLSPYNPPDLGKLMIAPQTVGADAVDTVDPQSEGDNRIYADSTHPASRGEHYKAHPEPLAPTGGDSTKVEP